MKQLMAVNDAPSMKFAEFFCTVGNRRYSMLNAKNFEAKATVTTANVPRLGSVVAGKKPTGIEIKLTCTVYKCSEMFDEIIEDFKNKGEMPTFDVQVTSEDPATSIGRSSKIYHNCVISGDVLLSAFNSDGEFIEQSIEAYALDWSTAESYTEPAYM